MEGHHKASAWRQESFLTQTQFHRGRLGLVASSRDEALLFLDLGVNLRLVIEIVCQRGMYLCTFQVRVVKHNFVRRPAVVKVIHGDLGHADSRKPLQVCRAVYGFFNVWIGRFDGHESLAHPEAE